MAAMQTIAISATSNAYSTSDAPWSSSIRWARTQVAKNWNDVIFLETPTLGGLVLTKPVGVATIPRVVGEHHGPLDSFRHPTKGLAPVIRSGRPNLAQF